MRWVRPVAVVVGFLTVGAGAGMGEEGSPPPRGAHAISEQPCDPYVRVAPEDRVTAPARSWRRGTHASVQVNVDSNGDNIVGDAANEPSIAVDPTDPSRMAIGWRQFDTIASDFRQAGRAFSTDHGASWTFPGVIEPGVFRSDPVLQADADGVFYYDSLEVPDIGGYSTDVYRSLDFGATWDGGVYAYGGDKQWFAFDLTGGIGQGNLYQAWDYAGCCGDDWFNRSVNGGATYETPVMIPGFPYWGMPAVGPDGTMYLGGISDDSTTGFAMAVSTTVKNPTLIPAFDFWTEVELGGQVVFMGSPSPNPGGLLGQVWTVADRSGGPCDGNVYVLASVDPPGAEPLDVHFVRSTDGGLSWSTPVRVNDDPVGSNSWQWFGTLAVAPNGRLDVIWNDTRNDSGGYLSELTYSFSEDCGMTWEPSEAISPQFNPHLGWPQQDKLGDYYDMVSDNDGADIAYAATFNGEQDVYYLRVDATSARVFFDGFESGGTSEWSSVQP